MDTANQRRSSRPARPVLSGLPGRLRSAAPDRRVVPGLYGIRVEERIAAGAYTVSAELPGIDPDSGLEISIADGLLFLLAERPPDPAGPRRSEFRYGAFARALPLPPGACGGEATARYQDGVVTVTVPCR